MDKQQLIEKLVHIDKHAFQRLGGNVQQKAEAVIVGSSALLLGDLLDEDTCPWVDVDVFQVNASGEVQEAIFSEPNVNGQCQAYVLNIPYTYEDRLQRVNLPTKAIDFFIPSPEDLAVMKLYRWSEQDVMDMTSKRFLAKLDWELLEQLVYGSDGAAASRIAEPQHDRELKQMRANYKMWRKTRRLACGM